MTSPTLRDRLYAKLDRRPNGCWIYKGGKTGAGYGNIYVGGGRHTAMAHRVSFELHVGPIAPGMHVCHTCDVKLCCNPDHLFLGTRVDNMQDMIAKGRHSHGPKAGELIRAGWTPEHRRIRSMQATEENRKRREEKAARAGAPLNSKFCPTCRRWLSRDDFGKNAARPDGLQPHCKPCRNAANIARRRKRNGVKRRIATRSDKVHFINSP